MHPSQLTISAEVRKTFDFEPEEAPRISSYGNEAGVLRVTVIRSYAGSSVPYPRESVRVEWSGVAVKKDGTLGKAHRRGSFWRAPWPEWLLPLMDRVPTPTAVHLDNIPQAQL